MPSVKCEDIRCYYDLQGEGPAVVLIHGLGSSARDWGPQTGVIAKDYKVLAPDLYGHGRTRAMPQHCRIESFAAQVAAMLAQENIGQAHVVGLSLGGAVALQLALSHPDLVASLVVVNSRPDFRIRRWQDRIMVLQRQLLIRLLGMRRMAVILAGRLFPASADLRAVFVERFAANRKTFYLRTLKALMQWSVQDRLAQLRCPLLWVAAEYDYVPPAEVEAFLAGLKSVSLAIMPGAHHAVTMEQADNFNDLLKRFLEAVQTGDESALATQLVGAMT